MKKLWTRLLSTSIGTGVQLRILMHITAKAFHVPAPSMFMHDNRTMLAQYASFTAEQAKKAAAQSKDLTQVSKDLYEEAYVLASRLRFFLKVHSEEEALSLLVILYRNIGIDLDGELPGQITIRKCYFSHVYTPMICRLISSLDAGIFAGLCGGGELKFTNRITEGSPMCCAAFDRSV